MNYAFLFQFFLVLFAYTFWKIVSASRSSYGTIELELDKDYLFWAREEDINTTNTQEEDKNV